MVGILCICKQSPSVLRVGRGAMPAPSSLEKQQGIFFPCPGFPADLLCYLKLSLCRGGWKFVMSRKGSFLGILHCSSSFASASASPRLKADGHWGSPWRPVRADHFPDGLCLAAKVYEKGVHCFYLKAQLCLWSYFCNTPLLKNNFIGCLILHQSNFKAD